MSVFSPSGSSTSTGGGGSVVSTPSIANETATLKDTEYSYAIPSGTKYFKFKARNSAKLQISFSSGTTNTVYRTLFPGFEYESPPFEIDSSITIYFRSSKDNTVVEFELWS